MQSSFSVSNFWDFTITNTTNGLDSISYNLTQVLGEYISQSVLLSVSQVSSPLADSVFLDKQKIIQDAYGLLSIEYSLLMTLNDTWHFTFKEFRLILQALPKSYANMNSIPKQRFLDSIKWANYIRGFRTYGINNLNSCNCTFCFEKNWEEYIDGYISLLEQKIRHQLGSPECIELKSKEKN